MAETEQRESSFCDQRHSQQVLRALLKQKSADATFCDVKMNVGGREIGAHSNILASVSPYFAEFFRAELPRGYSERSPQIIEILVDGNEADVSSAVADAVEAVVDFIYSGSLTVNSSNISHVAEIEAIQAWELYDPSVSSNSVDHARVMQLDSICNFCKDFLSGRLLSDHRLKPASDKIVDMSDVGIMTDSALLNTPMQMPIFMLSGLSSVMQNSAFTSSQSKLVRPSQMVSVATQVFPGMLNSDGGEMHSIGAFTVVSDSELACIVTNSKIVTASANQPSVVTSCRSTETEGEPKTVSRSAVISSAVIGCEQDDVQLSRDTTVSQLQHKSTKSAKLSNEDNLILPDTKRKREASASVDRHILDVKQGQAESPLPASLPKLARDSPDDKKQTVAKQKILNTKPLVVAKFQCSMCEFLTNNVRMMSAHIREHKLENNICYYCERRFESLELLNEHVKACHSDADNIELPFVCQECPARFRSHAQLTAHLPKHSAERPFICAMCGASFKWRCALRNHAATHNACKDQLCDICGYATAHRGQLRAHRLVHTGGTLRCSWPGCDFLATRLQSLKYHNLTHTQEKAHQCEVCGQSFSLVKNLKRHMLVHTDTAKKHKCYGCEFTTLRYDKLKEHLHKQHKVGSAPERRLRITDIVNQDRLNTIEPSPVPVTTPDQMEKSACGEISAPVASTNAIYSLTATDAFQMIQLTGGIASVLRSTADLPLIAAESFNQNPQQSQTVIINASSLEYLTNQQMNMESLGMVMNQLIASAPGDATATLLSTQGIVKNVEKKLFEINEQYVQQLLPDNSS